MNLWNLRNSKARLEIMEKTEAQRRHLMSIMSAKTRIDSHGTLKPKFHITLDSNQRQIDRDNQSMVKRILKINHSHSASNRSQSRSLSQNLKTYSSLNRSIRLKEIDDENSKMFSRLVTASPTIKRRQWVKREIQTGKYKENLHRSKYAKPDYSREACRMIIQEPKFKKITLPISFQEKKSAISKIKKF